MQARLVAVAGEESADGVASVDNVAGDEGGFHRFVARHQTVRVLDGEHRSIDDHSGKEDDPVIRSGHGRALGCRDVDAPMTGAVVGERRDEPAHDRVVRPDRPRPHRRGGRSRRRVDRRRPGEEQNQHEQDRQETMPRHPGGGERKRHGSTVAVHPASEHRQARVGAHTEAPQSVGERCYTLRSTSLAG
jgi:hypothetical protein